MLHELVESIESSIFSSSINIASGFSVCKLALEESKITKEMIIYFQDHPTQTSCILQRVVYLVEEVVDHRYAHPHDATLAGYLYVLRAIDLHVAIQTANYVLQLPNIWWTKKLAKQIIESYV